jgi:hypothetical protein
MERVDLIRESSPHDRDQNIKSSTIEEDKGELTPTKRGKYKQKGK